MEKQISRYLGRRVVMTYLDRKGQFSQREVMLQSMRDGRIRAIDCGKQAPRVFLVSNVLAVLPVMPHAV